MNWSFEDWPAITPQWHAGGQGHGVDDQIDFHVDLGCGRLKKGRIGIDRFPDAGVNVVADLDFPGAAQGLGGEPRNGIAVFAEAIQVGGDAYLEDWDVTPGTQPIIHSGLPFDDNSIESVLAHHAMEHVGAGYLNLMDEVWRVLKPGALFRIISPLFPSASSIVDPDHRRYFTKDSFEYFQASPDGHVWTELFSTPGYRARFDVTNKDISPYPEEGSVWDSHREIRVTLRAVKPHAR
jgi:SAM-dependent methyltransferase